MSANPCSSDWIPDSIEEWCRWLSEQEKKTLDAYRAKPDFLIADYHREQSIARDYSGRELLELLQNANDQAAESGEGGRVLIELTKESLIVANTGRAFSVGGVTSLQTAHLSPKRRRRKQVIGNKGLGFRAVLNCSKNPIILSKSLRIAYCQAYAERISEEISKQSADIADKVRDEKQGSDELILARLPFPKYFSDSDLRLSDERAQNTLIRCESVLCDGYDTVIGMPFDFDTAHAAIAEQIQRLRAELLLFVPNIAEICFQVDGTSPIKWRRQDFPLETISEVLRGEESLGKWRIYSESKALPELEVESGPGEATHYEIVVAVPVKAQSPGVLFSYFPTEVPLPLPLVCHATLELEQNRKHLQQGRRSNRYVLRRLASYLAEISEAEENLSGAKPWSGCSLLMANSDYPEELVREGFPQALIESAKTRRIVPTTTGKPLPPNSARQILGIHSSGWLSKEIFSEVAAIRDANDSRFLGQVGVAILPPTEIKKRLIAAPAMTLDQRVALIGGLIEGGLIEAYTSALFLDSDGNSLADAIRVFLPPVGEKSIALPTWAKLRFLHTEMGKRLSERLKTRDSRELQQKLMRFGVQEYALAPIIRALFAEAHRIENNNPAAIDSLRTDLIAASFGLYTAEHSGTKRPDFPDQVSLFFRNQEGSWTPAKNLFLGHGFGPDGEICQDLFGGWAPGKLVAVVDLPPLAKSPNQLRDFMMWAGIAQWPRGITLQSSEASYLRELVLSVRWPAQFGDSIIRSQDDLSCPSASEVKSVEYLKEILQHAPYSAIVAWLARDDRSLEWGRFSPLHAKLHSSLPRKQYARTYQGGLTSYCRWCIESAIWIKTSDNRSFRPKDCMFGDRAIEELFPRPAMPAEELLERYGIQLADIWEGWRRAGIVTSLAQLDRDQVYARLLEIPQRSPDGKLARSLCHWLLDADEGILGLEGPNKRAFLASGKMWGSHGDMNGYFSVKELRYSDVEGLPEALLKKLKVVSLRPRAGARKVEKLFGISPIERAELKRQIVAKEIAVGSSDANHQFQDAKKFLHKLRAARTSQSSQLELLKHLQLEICSKLRVGLSYENEQLEYDVPVWGWMIEGQTLHVRSDPAKMSIGEALLADVIGEALSTEIFRITDGGDFARILACKEGDRLELLRRLLGEKCPIDLDALSAEYAQSSSRITHQVILAPASPSTATPVTAAPTKSPDEDDEASRKDKDNQPATSMGPLEVIPKEHTPVPPKKARHIQVTRIITPKSAQSGTARRVTDGDFCEEKAMEFEVSDSESPRWPLQVGDNRGYASPGCDILSFETEEALRSFVEGPNRDLNTVLRFIEVKGRGSLEAEIRLEGNELSAAERYGARYFLYRLFKDADGEFELAILQDPLRQTEALSQSVRIDMKRAETTKRFSLKGGLRNSGQGQSPEQAS